MAYMPGGQCRMLGCREPAVMEAGTCHQGVCAECFPKWDALPSDKKRVPWKWGGPRPVKVTGPRNIPKTHRECATPACTKLAKKPFKVCFVCSQKAKGLKL